MNLYDMMCDFIKINDYQYKCRTCGTTISHFEGSDYPTMMCHSKITEYNPVEYGIRITNIDQNDEPKINPESQKIDDLKKCSLQQIEDRFAVCNSCEFYKNNTCEKCGCYLVRDQIYMNKLAWKDQSCPIGKWKAIY
jgi:hypothetical protein